MSQPPTSPSRRQFERTPAKAQVFVHCRGHFQRARIVDYSQVGMQLAGTFGLIKTDLVTIELVSGVRVQGKVEWSLGGQTGIVFLQQLEPSHVAMEELARSAVPRRSPAP